MEYLGLGLAMDGEFFRKKGIILLLRAAAEPQFMLKGTQTINEQLYDLKGGAVRQALPLPAGRGWHELLCR